MLHKPLSGIGRLTTAVVLLCFSLLVAVALAYAANLHLQWSLLIVLPFGMLLWVFTEIIRKGAARYANLQSWQETVEPDDGQYCVPEHLYDRFRHLLLQVWDEKGEVAAREDSIKRIWRQHPVALAQQIALPVLAAITFLALTMAALVNGKAGSLQIKWGSATQDGSAAPSTSPPAPVTLDSGFTISPPTTDIFGRPLGSAPVYEQPHISFPWWLFVLLTVAALLTVLVLVWRWSCICYAITNFRLTRAMIPPPWLLPIIQVSVQRVDLHRIITVRERTSALGIWWNYGEVGLDTEADTGDLPFNNIRYAPNPQLTAQILDAQRRRAQQLRGKIIV
jgi:hypothetical protein